MRRGPHLSLDDAPQVPCQWHYRVQGQQRRGISERIARLAYAEYADQGHGGQSFERLHERGGFGSGELIMLLAERVERLEEANAKLRKRIGR